MWNGHALCCLENTNHEIYISNLRLCSILVFEMLKKKGKKRTKWLQGITRFVSKVLLQSASSSASLSSFLNPQLWIYCGTRLFEEARSYNGYSRTTNKQPSATTYQALSYQISEVAVRLKILYIEPVLSSHLALLSGRGHLLVVLMRECSMCCPFPFLAATQNLIHVGWLSFGKDDRRQIGVRNSIWWLIKACIQTHVMCIMIVLT